MNSYQPATADMAFILETVLQESARFVGEVIAPLNRAAYLQPCNTGPQVPRATVSRHRPLRAGCCPNLPCDLLSSKTLF
jgi:hypothetical protein